jgi:hypothetical protein
LIAYKQRVSTGDTSASAKPCCGVYVQQVNRIARLKQQIQIWSEDNQPSSIRDLRLAIKRIERMENWLAAHTHETSLPGAEGAPVPIEQAPGDHVQPVVVGPGILAEHTFASKTQSLGDRATSRIEHTALDNHPV